MRWLDSFLRPWKDANGLQPLAAAVQAPAEKRPDIPTAPMPAMSGRYEPSCVARMADVGYVHSVLMAAESGDTRELFALYRDVLMSTSHLQAELFKRKLAVLGDQISLQPLDDTPAAADVAAAVKRDVLGCKRWRVANSHLLDSTLWPVAVVEKIFEPVAGGYTLQALIPVPHFLQDYRSGQLRIFDVGPDGQPLPSSHEADPARYIIHRGHLLTAPDHWGGPMRSVLFWWLLLTMTREWWVRFLDRYGSPFPVGKFRDEEGRTVLERAFALAHRLGGLVVTEGTEVELKQASASDSGEAYKAFLEICEREMSKLVIGQTMAADSQQPGVGGDTAGAGEKVRDDIRQFDAVMLSDTLRDQLISQYCAINGMQGLEPTLTWGSESAREIQGKIGLLKGLGEAGLEVDDAGIASVSKQIGFTLRRKTGGALPPPSMFAAPEVGELHPFLRRRWPRDIPPWT